MAYAQAVSNVVRLDPANAIWELSDAEIDAVSGAVDVGQVAAGVAIAGGATLAIALAPAAAVGAVAVGAYFVTMFAAGVVVGDGLAKK